MDRKNGTAVTSAAPRFTRRSTAASIVACVGVPRANSVGFCAFAFAVSSDRCVPLGRSAGREDQNGLVYVRRGRRSARKQQDPNRNQCPHQMTLHDLDDVDDALVGRRAGQDCSVVPIVTTLLLSPAWTMTSPHPSEV